MEFPVISVVNIFKWLFPTKTKNVSSIHFFIFFLTVLSILSSYDIKIKSFFYRKINRQRIVKLLYQCSSYALAQWNNCTGTQIIVSVLVGSDVSDFGTHCSANFRSILDCFILSFNFTYEDLENIKTFCVDTVVFNLHQIKQRNSFGTPIYETVPLSFSSPCSLATWGINYQQNENIEIPLHPLLLTERNENICLCGQNENIQSSF